VKIREFVITHPLIQDPKRLVPQIPLSFLNQKYNSLDDTGSTMSVFSLNVLPKGTKFYPWTKRPILMLEGSETVPLGGYSLEFQLSNRKYTHFFAVLRSFEGVLLGMDFLHSCGLVFDMSNLTWGFSNSFPSEYYKLSVCQPEGPSSLNLQLLQHYEQDEIMDLLKQFPDVIDAPLGRVKSIKHRFQLIEERPKKQRPYTMSQVKHDEIRRQVDYMIENRIIRKSKSVYASSVLLRTKSDGSWRFCVDYRHVNSLTPHDSFHIPKVQDLLRRLANTQYISTMDAEKGNWQIQMHQKSKKYTAFCTDRGLFEYNCMPFGLKIAPATYQRMMNELLNGLGDFCIVYKDDVLVFSKSFEEYKRHLQAVLERFRDARLTLTSKKCQYGKSFVKFLIVSSDGIGMNADKVTAIKAFPTSKTRRQLKGFLGMIGWYSNSVERYAD
jgi:hypothetical protein